MSAIATRPRASSSHVVVAIGMIGLVCLGFLVARFPLLTAAAVVTVPIVLVAGLRSMSRDVEYFAVAILLLSAVANLPRQVPLGPITLGGVVTVLVVMLAVLLLVHDSGRLGAAWRSIWPLIGFLAWSWLGLLLGGTSVEGFQNVAVFTGFIAIATVAYVRGLDDETLPRHLETLFERSFWLLVALGVLSIARYGPGGGFLVPEHGTSRSFALLLLPMIASGLSRWRYGERRRGAVMAVIGIALVALSLSRAAFVTGCALFAIAWFRPRSIAGFARVVAGLAAAAAVLWAGTMFIGPLNDRFFATSGDLVHVGRYTFTATGRTQLWSETWHQFEQSPWIGHGAGSSQEFLTALGGARHPHNDYLRLLHDFGIAGTALWAVGIVLIGTALYRAWLRRDVRGDPRARMQLWALLSMGALLATMITANPLVYMHIQGPLGLIIGVALATAAGERPGGVTEWGDDERVRRA